MLRIVLKLSFFVDELREIKYILYLGAFIYGFFVGHNLCKDSHMLIVDSLLGTLIFIFGVNLLATILFLIEGF
jgi:hypothetical protein